MRKLLPILGMLALSCALSAQSWVRVNQAGYLPTDIKVAVLISMDEADGSFEVYDAITDEIVFKGKGKSGNASKWGMKKAYRLDFSSVNRTGGYYIKSNGATSPVFKIGADVYDGIADYLLVYMRQQRCGDNPFNGELCHQHDGYIVDHPTRSGEKIDVTGGWHDATDYLQYLTTSATTTYHMLFAYQEAEDKSVFKDLYDARGRKGANGIPDILDEAKWGLDWLVKMNPEDKVMFNQIADDRDHAGFRVPYKDTVDYGWGPGKGRPVYFVTGERQGLSKYINRTTGVSSSAAKFASTFALGSEVMREYYPEFCDMIYTKAELAYNYATEDKLGNTQTACTVSPFFYEEDSFVDDIELAAATFMHHNKGAQWVKQADYWGELEPVSPWMELGRGRHYQYYPFINLGHYYLAKNSDEAVSAKYTEYMRQGLQDIKDRASDDPFMNGVPYIWCSNNLVSAAVSQARLYNEVSGDNSFLEMEMALRDWLLGCNPWGTSMIVGYPDFGDYPDYPHSSYFVVNGDMTYGGLVDGPVYYTVFKERADKYMDISENPYNPFNNGIAVYHDDLQDFSTNEPTMDGTAGLTYYFGKMESKGNSLKKTTVVRDSEGAAIRVNPDEKKVYFIFSADTRFNGGNHILKTLDKYNIKGSFFLTGNCLRMEEHKELIQKIIDGGHYVSGHSDNHLLYAPWGDRDSSLVSRDSLIRDLKLNMAELEKFGVKAEDAAWFLPPYEYYNHDHVNWLELAGMKVMNLTPGTATAADYTTPDMPNYRTAQALINSLMNYEEKAGLNGAIILIHPGIESSRPDPLYMRLGEIIKTLKKKGYTFGSFSELK